jgi:hypothetical protein
MKVIGRVVVPLASYLKEGSTDLTISGSFEVRSVDTNREILGSVDLSIRTDYSASKAGATGVRDSMEDFRLNEIKAA